MSTLEARKKFRETFPRKISVLWVVHCLGIEQTINNVKISIENWLHWVFLINHWDIRPIEFLEIIKKTREEFKNIWMWLNFLGQWELDSVEEIWKLEDKWTVINWLWTDNPEIIWVNPWYNNQDKIKKYKEEIGWNWIYFWGVLFKWQPKMYDEKLACEKWAKYLDVITTSGPWTWISAEMDKIERIRKYSWEHPVWLASWVDASNIEDYSKLVDVCLVASSISKNFHNFDQVKVRELGNVVERINW